VYIIKEFVSLLSFWVKFRKISISKVHQIGEIRMSRSQVQNEEGLSSTLWGGIKRCENYASA
jgi:hypothetical protein